MEIGRRDFGIFLLGMFPLLRQDSNPTAETQSGRPREQGDEPSAVLHRGHSRMETVLKENQEKIKKDIQRLYDLVSNLKNEVEKTDSSKMLSLNLVKTAEEAEKLARHIRTLALG